MVITLIFIYIHFTDELAEIFGFGIYEEVLREQTYNPPTHSPHSSHNKWAKGETTLLIQLWKDNYADIVSTTIKNEQVYKKIALDLNAQGYIYTEANR